MTFNHTGLDKLFDVEKGIVTALIGGPGTGKTSLALCLAKNFSNPYFVDTEGLSMERVKQIGVSQLRIARVREFENQTKIISSFDLDADLLIIDSLVMLYRLELAKDHEKANRLLSRQISKLHNLADKLNIPILITGHVYKKDGKKKVVGGDIVKYWAKSIILLEKKGFSKRKATLLKSRSRREGTDTKFKLCETGVC
ncbi:MAG: AAA family ATPase [Candidatus Altiarchaeota archaeon]|nr:AAA family ATPase [Candidatus Altiarchaeota archaeon]